MRACGFLGALETEARDTGKIKGEFGLIGGGGVWYGGGHASNCTVGNQVLCVFIRHSK